MDKIINSDTVTSHDEMNCDEARWQLCRLAAGARLRRRALDLARHVKRCAACDGFADELAGVRGQLGLLATQKAPRPSRRRLEQRARAALVRELEARLARDLLAGAQGRSPRPLAERRDDVLRLGAMRGEQALRRGLLGEVAATVQGRRVATSDRALQLAYQLDPVGLDVALAWLGHLERRGDPSRAHGLASQLLADVP